MAQASRRARWFFSTADFKIATQLRHSGIDIRCILKAIEQASNMPSCQPDALTLHFVCNFERVAKYQKFLARSQEGMPPARPTMQQPQPADFATHLGNIARRLKSAATSCNHSPIHNVLLSAAASVDRIQTTGSYRKIEQELSEIQSTLDQQLIELLNQQDRQSLYADARTALKDFSERVSSHIFDEMLAKSALSMARKKYNVPRLSIFRPICSDRNDVSNGT